jgi:hypothetical protein
MDDQQLQKEYQDFCRFHVNPPSFDTWKSQRKTQMEEFFKTKEAKL